jgi:hypothetical protein
MGGVPDLPVAGLLAVEPEAGLGGGPVDQEGQRDGLPALGRVVRVDPDVVLGVGLSAFAHLEQDADGVVQVEHGQAPHLPVGVAGVGILGELHRQRPAPVEGVLDLGPDLVVGQVGQVGEGSLGDAHDLSWPGHRVTGVATASGTSVGS